MHVIYIITLSLIFVSFYGVISSIIQAFELMEYISLGSVIYNFTMLICALVAIYLGVDVYGFAYVYLVSSIIIVSYYVIVALKKFPLPKWEIDFNLWKYLVKEAIPFGLSTVFIRVYYYIDTVMISLMILNPNEVIGWYNAAYTLVSALSFINAALITAIFPSMSNAFISSKESFKWHL